MYIGHIGLQIEEEVETKDFGFKFFKWSGLWFLDSFIGLNVKFWKGLHEMLCGIFNNHGVVWYLMWLW